MKFSTLLLACLLTLSAVVFLASLSGCSTTSGSTAATQIEPYLPLISGAASLATTVALNEVVKNPTKRSAITSKINASATALLALDKGTIPTIDEFTAVFKVSASDEIEYRQYVTDLTNVYTAYYSKLVSAGDPALAAEVIGAIATGTQTATDSYADSLPQFRINTNRDLRNVYGSTKPESIYDLHVAKN